jgi:16S rRNA processing protein RimM
MQSVLIGQIVNVHGIKGEVKVYPYTDDVDNLARRLKKIYLDENLKDGYKTSCRVQKGMLLVKISGIDTVEKAESLRNRYIYISEDALETLEEDSYYVKDLIGLEIIDIKNNETVGTLEYVYNTGANDVYEINTKDNTKIYLPAIKQVIKKVDIKSRKIYVEIMEGLI